MRQETHALCFCWIIKVAKENRFERMTFIISSYFLMQRNWNNIRVYSIYSGVTETVTCLENRNPVYYGGNSQQTVHETLT